MSVNIYNEEGKEYHSVILEDKSVAIVYSQNGIATFKWKLDNASLLLISDLPEEQLEEIANHIEWR